MKRVIEVLLVGFIASFLSPIGAPNAVAATISKTIVVKDSGGNLVQNALVRATWFDDAKGEHLGETVTTNASGAASVSYGSEATYSYLLIQPSGNTLALTRVNNFHSFTNSTIDVVLKKADLVVELRNSDNSPAAAGSAFSLMKYYVQTLRTGSFGVSALEGVYLSSNNVSVVYPAPSEKGQFNSFFYYTRTKTDTGWQFRFFTDAALTKEVLPQSGVQVLKLRGNNVQITLKNSQGTISLTEEQVVHMYGNRIANPGSAQTGEFYDEIYSQVSNSGIWKGSFVSEGSYPLMINSLAQDVVPAMAGPTIYVDANGKVSTTNSNFQDSLNLELEVPSPTFKIKLLDSEQNQSAISFSANIAKKVGDGWKYETGDQYPSNFYSPQGIGSVVLPTGQYRMNFYSGDRSRPETIYYFNVGETKSVLSSDGVTIVPKGGVYELPTTEAKLKFRLIDGGTLLTYSSINFMSQQTKNYFYSSSDDKGSVYTNLPDGSYQVTIDASNLNTMDPPRIAGQFDLVVTSGSVSSLKRTSNQQSIQAANGFYDLGLDTPNSVFTVQLDGQAPEANTYFNATLWRWDSDQNQVISKDRPLVFNSSFRAGALLTLGGYRVALWSSRPGTLFAPSDECSITSTISNTCLINFPKVNFQLKVKDQNNNLLNDRYYVTAYRLVSTDKSFPSTGATPNFENSIISGRLFDGEYRFIVAPNQTGSNLGGNKTFRATVLGGKVTKFFDVNDNVEVLPEDNVFNVSLQKTNLRAQVKLGSTPINNAWVQTYELTKFSIGTQWNATNSEGKFEFYLADGEHQVEISPPYELGSTATSASYRVTVSNSTISKITDASGVEVAPVEGIYPLLLGSPNVTGKLQITGNASDSYQGHISAYRVSTDGRYFEGTSGSRIDSNGSFGLKLEPGKYILNSFLYSNGRNLLSTQFCEVPTTGSKDCSEYLAFPAENLKFNVVDGNGSKVNGEVSASLRILLNEGMTPMYSSIQTPYESNQTFAANLLDGTYQLILSPFGKTSSQGALTNIEIKVTAGVVETKDCKLVGGVCTFTLRQPTLKGVVTVDDGTTPYPYASIDAQRENMGYGFQAGADGSFGILLEVDGAYELLARPQYNDPLFGQSMIVPIGVKNGVQEGSSGIVKFVLRRSTVTGTVTGPNDGISKSNWINVQKKDENGNFQYIPRLYGKATNSQGVFGFYLEPGTYRFEAQADQSVGGVRTFSSDCIITQTEFDAKNKVCNIKLSSSNVRVKVTNPANQALLNAYGYFNLIQSSGTVVKYWEYFSTDSEGIGKTFLEDGVWNLQLYPPYNENAYSQTNFTVTIKDGKIDSIVDSTGTTVSQTDQNYVLKLNGVNLIGDITFGPGKQRINHWAEVVVKRRNQNGDFDWITNRGTGNGQFGFKVEPGIYRLEARPYYGENLDRTTSRSELCEVKSSGQTTCSIELKAPNFFGKVLTAAGQVFREASVNLYTEKASGDTWEYWLELNNGNFGAYLEKGVYRINVQPYWQYRSLYSEQNYQVTVAADGAISVINILKPADTVNKTNNRYELKLGTPGVKGTVKRPTGDSVVSNVQVVPIDEKGQERWEFSTQSDSQGKFGLTLPEGKWSLWARVWGGGKDLADSARTPIVVKVDGTLESGGEIELRLQTPNLKGTVLAPTGGTPLANVNVSAYVGNQYFWSWTNEKGEFGFKVDGEITSCASGTPAVATGNCYIYLTPWNNTLYTSIKYDIADLGDKSLAVGGVNTTITVTRPFGAAFVANKWSYVAVEEKVKVGDEDRYLWQPGGFTNEQGLVGLSLTTGKNYRITAYPNWEIQGEFSPKVLTIVGFVPGTNYPIVFDSPNLKISVKDKSDVANSGGWYEIFTVTGTGDSKSVNFYRYGKLNELGTGSQYLEDGTYQINFWPSPSALGIMKTVEIVVEAAKIKLDNVELVGGQLNIKLPGGNVSGIVKDKTTNLPISGAVVVAVYEDVDPTKNLTVTTVTLSDGTFELLLDLARTWKVKVLDPVSGKKSDTAVDAVAEMGTLLL